MDQRAYYRPVNSLYDIGSVEIGANNIVTGFTGHGGATQRSRVVSIEVNFAEANPTGSAG